jgi:peptide/nickel transport system ATP-binding protein
MSDNLTLPAQQGSTGTSAETLLKVEGLTKHFPIYGGFPIKRKVGAVST